MGTLSKEEKQEQGEQLGWRQSEEQNQHFIIDGLTSRSK